MKQEEKARQQYNKKSENSDWETALFKVGNLGAETLISADLCRVIRVINAGIFTSSRNNLLRDKLCLFA